MKHARFGVWLESVFLLGAAQTARARSSSLFLQAQTEAFERTTTSRPAAQIVGASSVGRLP